MSALDTEYFRRKMELIIRDLSHYKPQEMARELVRLAKVADESETSKEAAQAEPAKECGNCFEGKSDMDHACRTCGGTGVATNDAGQELLPCPFCGSAAHVQYDPIGLATNARVHCVAMDCRADVWSDQGKDAAIAMWNRRTTPAQATPEGAELPPLPRAYGYLTGRNLDMESSLEAAQAVCDRDNAAERELQACSQVYADPDWEPAKPEPLFDADQMRDHARAALAATTAAEPVAWAYPASLENLATLLSLDRDYQYEMPMYAKKSNGLIPLYRAAPPQQVDTGGLPG